MEIKVELDERGNCSKHCPNIEFKGGIPIMVGGGMCVYMCIHYRSFHRENGQTYIECGFKED